MNQNANFDAGMVNGSFEDEEPTDFDCHSFYFTDSEGNRDLEAHIQLPEDAQWTTALEHYLDFLSNIYGYDLRQQVAVKVNPFRERFAWSGPVFSEGAPKAPDPEQLELNFGGTD